MLEKYFNATGEIAFRMWMYANTVEALKANPNEEKATNLKAKMANFAIAVAELGTLENKTDLEALIAEL